MEGGTKPFCAALCFCYLCGGIDFTTDFYLSINSMLIGIICGETLISTKQYNYVSNNRYNP